MTPDDEELLQHIRQIGLIRGDDIEDARMRVKRLEDKGQEGNIYEILQSNGMITADQIRRFRTGLGKVIPTCFRCLKRSVLDEGGFGGSYICQHCQEPVSLKDKTAGLGDELLPNPPERIVDKIVEKLVLKGGVPAAKVEGLKRDRKKMVPRPTLLEMFLIKKVLTEDKYLALKGKAGAIYRKRFTDWSKLQQDFELASFLCRVRVVAQKSLSEELQKQMERALNNRYVSLRDSLVRSGAMTEYQMREFLPEHFDKVSRRMVLLNGLPGAGDVDDEDDLEDSEWEDSLVELGDELEEDDGLNVIALEEGEPPPPAGLNPREEQQRKMFSSFYEKEMGNLEALTKKHKRKPK